MEATLIWVVERFGLPYRAWLSARHRDPPVATFRILEAATFVTAQDARNEIARLGLSDEWKAEGLRTSKDSRSGGGRE